MTEFIELQEWFLSLNAIWQSLMGGLFTWGLTALGAALVFFFRTIRQKVLDSMLGFAAGVMIAASFWSLLAPSIEMAVAQGVIAWLPAVVGFLAGGIFLRVCHAYMPRLRLVVRDSQAGARRSAAAVCDKCGARLTGTEDAGAVSS
jgi:ZIP family zinc transporter